MWLQTKVLTRKILLSGLEPKRVFNAHSQILYSLLIEGKSIICNYLSYHLKEHRKMHFRRKSFNSLVKPFKGNVYHQDESIFFSKTTSVS